MNILTKLLTGIVLMLFAYNMQAQERLVVTPHMVINLGAHGEEFRLFDDQRLSESYGCEIPQTDNIWNFFDATWNGKFFYFPVEVVVDFGEAQDITRLCLRKGGGPNANDPIQIFTTDTNPTEWDFLLEHRAGGAECYDIDPIQTRYVMFRFMTWQSKIREIELYGSQKNSPVCAPESQASTDCGSPRFKMEDFIGSNTNLDIPPAKANAVGFVRNYHGIFLSEGYDRPNYPGYPANEFNWRPEFSEEAFDYDFFFQGFQDLGLDVGNSIHRASPYLTTFAYKTGDLSYNAAVPFNDGTISVGKFIKVTERKPFSERFYPIQIDMVADDPDMYLEFADVMYQFTGRYGRNPDAANMKVAASNEALSGLGTVQYLENWNEPDKWWHFGAVNDLDFLDPYVEEQLGYFSPFEYAAMSSATYDGNGMTNGVQNAVRTRYPDGAPSNAGPVGIQAADPSMKMVMAGISELNPKYVRAMMFWFEHYRPDIEFPFDVINFHDYSNNGTNGAPLGTHALSPEEYGLKEKLEEVADFRNRYLPNTELWLSEFGYDSHPRSIQSADCTKFCNDCDSPECLERFREIQGQWIVRSFLETAAAGIDRAMVFNMRDGSPEASAGLYQTSGMTTYRGDYFQNKNSWYYVSTMKQTLEGLKYDPTFVFDDDRVRMYRFVDECDADGKTVYAIWSPTSNSGTNVPVLERYQIDLPANEATLIRLTDGDMDGERSTLRPVNGKFQIDISERPKFIVIGDMKPDVDGCACDYLKYEIVDGDANYNMLNDEQALIGGPLCVEGDSMFTQWNARAEEQVIIDLKAEYDLSSMFVYSDTLATANVEIYYGEPNNWTLFNTWDTRNVTRYRWKVFDNFDLQTRYLRFKTLDDDAFIHEIAFCGTIIEGTESTCDDGIQNGDETGIDCGGSCTPCERDLCPIELSANMFFEADGRAVTKSNGIIALVDEPDTENPIQPWLDPWTNNTSAYLDLGQEYRLDSIFLYDGNGAGNFQVRPGKPSDRTITLVDIETNAWPPQWRGFEFDVQTRYLTFTKGSGGAKINEIRICGTALNSTPTCNDGIQNGDETGIDCGGSCAPCKEVECPLPLSADMFFDGKDDPITSANGIIALVDESDSDSPSRAWTEPWSNNATAYLDLGAAYRIENIALFDGNGSGNFKVLPGRPSDNQAAIIDIETNVWPPQWRGFSVDNVVTRYLTFVKVSGGSRINEIEICGVQLSEGEALAVPSVPVKQLQANIQPNPSIGQSILQYELSENAQVQINLWSITGQKIRRLLSANQEAGFQNLTIDAQLASGLYLIEIRANDQREVMKWIVE